MHASVSVIMCVVKFIPQTVRFNSKGPDGKSTDRLIKIHTHTGMTHAHSRLTYDFARAFSTAKVHCVFSGSRTRVVGDNFEYSCNR
jgi:hypothetical protein